MGALAQNYVKLLMTGRIREGKRNKRPTRGKKYLGGWLGNERCLLWGLNGGVKLGWEREARSLAMLSRFLMGDCGEGVNRIVGSKVPIKMMTYR